MRKQKKKMRKQKKFEQINYFAISVKGCVISNNGSYKLVRLDSVIPTVIAGVQVSNEELTSYVKKRMIDHSAFTDSQVSNVVLSEGSDSISVLKTGREVALWSSLIKATTGSLPLGVVNDVARNTGFIEKKFTQKLSLTA